MDNLRAAFNPVSLNFWTTYYDNATCRSGTIVMFENSRATEDPDKSEYSQDTTSR